MPGRNHQNGTTPAHLFSDITFRTFATKYWCAAGIFATTHRRCTKNAAARAYRSQCSIVLCHLQARRTVGCDRKLSRRIRCDLFKVCEEPKRNIAAQERATA